MCLSLCVLFFFCFVLSEFPACVRPRLDQIAAESLAESNSFTFTKVLLDFNRLVVSKGCKLRVFIVNTVLSADQKAES